MGKRPNVNAFGIACVAHEFLAGRFNNIEFTVPMNSTNTVEYLIENWMKSKTPTNWTRIDQVEWPHNVPCARKAVMAKYRQTSFS